MPYWVFQSRESSTLREAASWLDVVPGALEELGFDLPRIRVGEGPDGCLRVADSEGRIVVLVHPGIEDQGGAAALLDSLAPLSEGRIADFDTSLPADETALPSEVAERLFELTTPIDEAATAEEAAEIALDLVLSIVPAEAGSVLHADLDRDRFAFLAARGPAADAVRNYTLPFGRGHVGAVHDSGVAVLLHDVQHSARHMHGIDEVTGFDPQALIAVPMRSSDGRSWGVMELLSTHDRMFSWHLTVADTVATTLAERLAASSEI